MIFITVYDDCHFDWFMMDSKLVFKSWIIIPVYDYITGVNRVSKGRLEPWNYLVCKTILGKHVRYTIPSEESTECAHSWITDVISQKKEMCPFIFIFFIYSKLR